MAELEAISEEANEALGRIGSASVVIGVPCAFNHGALARAIQQVRATVAAMSGSPRTVVLHSEATEAFSGNGVPSGADSAGVELIPFPFPAVPQSRFDSVRPVLETAQRLSAVACCVWNADPETMTATALQSLLHPVTEAHFDLAVARYAGLRYDALINSSIVYPLTRALYGLRIRYPMATDLAFSAKLAERLMQPDSKTGRPAARNWIPAFAACERFQICQADLGLRLPPSPAPDASTALVNVLEPLMADVERNALFWQRFRGSQPVPVFGDSVSPEDTPRPIDVNKMIEAYQLGCGNLKEVWGVVQPPATMLQLKKIAALPAEKFRMADDLWARCVYDFVLGYHLRLMSADHLIRAMTPIYLAWVASYALEVQDFTSSQVEDRLEQLCIAFEAQKPYFLSRWRWPDRFNP